MSRTPTQMDELLREHLLELLEGHSAHVDPKSALSDFPEKLRGVRPPSLPYSGWELLEHMRIAQHDILDFSTNQKYKPKNWPADYWPKSNESPAPDAWDKSVREFFADLDHIKELVKNPKTDLFERISHGEGQTILREAMLAADHNAYHLGQIVLVRRALGAWK